MMLFKESLKYEQTSRDLIAAEKAHVVPREVNIEPQLGLRRNQPPPLIFYDGSARRGFWFSRSAAAITWRVLGGELRLDPC